HLGLYRGGKPVSLRRIQQQVERIQAAEDLRVRPVQIGLAGALAVQLPDAVQGALLELGDWPELDRPRRAGLGARRHQAVLEPVVAERAFLGDVLFGADVDHAERAGRDAVAAAVADGLLDVDRVELGAYDRPRRADLE